ncbi:hypothetical protein K0028_10925 [Curtobacterium flaccumfaciens pv. flaccumfaciens]|uniref:hypothetical protein n=1 Tax=Curtobacterium flaccumfaciens TaxID=2035 RepID=UPI0021B09EF9|nr:hypothetical protein [Curtobacterium flaccumfaciens]QYI96220.1 hypothetical protein K0028_10925 [Curtobacterium flaccumfaciens pv. flaccumfaciens]
MNTKSTYSFSVEHEGPRVTMPLPPKGPWGTTWFVVRSAGVTVGVASVAFPLLMR